MITDKKAVVGVTGSFGTGKTFVASIFKSLGAKVLDADRIAHKAMKKATPAYKRIVGEFGIGILGKDGEIDRKKLSEVVFSDRRSLEALNKIVHPAVIRFIKSKIRKTNRGVIVIDAPLLVEANLVGIVDRLVVVTASRAAQIKRCAKRFGMKREDIIRRIENQIPISRKINMADFVVDNNGTRSKTRKQVKAIWRRLWR